MGYLERAKELESELIVNRRSLHGFAEIRFELPKTLAFVKEKLRQYGLEPIDTGRSGVSCTIGQGGKTFLLRCDMDALPMEEESGLDFAAENGNCHSCGHDAHTAILLCAAKMLKERDKELKGTVKLMFQPAEEVMGGAKDMIKAGILENPKVEAALALHVSSGMPYSKVGHVLYRDGSAMNSSDSLNIKVKGVSAHGAMPYMGVDAIYIASHIVIALQEIVSREAHSGKDAIITVGTISGGITKNTLAPEAQLGLSVRAENAAIRELLLRRIREISEGVAAMYRGSVEINSSSSTPALENDKKFTAEMASYAMGLLPAGTVEEYPRMPASEDFAYIAEKVPATMILLGCGAQSEGYKDSLHNPCIVFDERAFHVGAATLAHCAEQWLQNN